MTRRESISPADYANPVEHHRRPRAPWRQWFAALGVALTVTAALAATIAQVLP